MSTSANSQLVMELSEQRRHLDRAAAADCCRHLVTDHDDDDDDDDDDAVDDSIVDDVDEIPTVSAACPTEPDGDCCCVWSSHQHRHQHRHQHQHQHQHQPTCAQSLSSLATCSTSSRSSACEVGAEWLQQDAAEAGADDASASSASAVAADADAGVAKPLDRLRSSLNSLRLGRQHQHHHHHHHQQGSRGCRPSGVGSRRRSSAISAKSKSQYLTQYKAAKATYFRAVVHGQAPVRERHVTLDMDAWR